jgi:hypothetical protein
MDPPVVSQLHAPMVGGSTQPPPVGWVEREAVLSWKDSITPSSTTVADPVYHSHHYTQDQLDEQQRLERESQQWICLYGHKRNANRCRDDNAEALMWRIQHSEHLKSPLCLLASFEIDVCDMSCQIHTALKRGPVTRALLASLRSNLSGLRSNFDKIMELGDLADLRGAGRGFPSWKDPKSNGSFDKLAGDINLRLEALELEQIETWLGTDGSDSSEVALAMEHEARAETPAWATARAWWGAAKDAAASVPF